MPTTSTPTTVPVPRDGPPAASGVPSLDEIYRLTAVPEDRVLFHNVDWAFYEHLVDSIPESSNIHLDYPNPDLAIEVDISPPRVDRAAIYAALRVAEVWRFDGRELVIERLTPEGTYVPVEASQFLPVRADEVRRWLVEEDSRQKSAWARRLRAYIRGKRES